MRRERKKIVQKGEVDEVSTTTVHAQNEQLPELCWGYETRNTLNLDELGLFLKALTEKCLMEKRKKTKGGKKSKQRMTVTSDGCLVFEATLIWRSKGPHCFKSLKVPPIPINTKKYPYRNARLPYFGKH